MDKHNGNVEVQDVYNVAMPSKEAGEMFVALCEGIDILLGTEYRYSYKPTTKHVTVFDYGE